MVTDARRSTAANEKGSQMRDICKARYGVGIIALAFALVGTAPAASAAGSPARGFLHGSAAAVSAGSSNPQLISLNSARHQASPAAPGMRARSAISSDDHTFIFNANSSLVMEVYHSQTAEYANVDQYTYNGSPTQQWDVINEYPNLNIYEFKNDNSHKCLDVYHSGTADYTNVDQKTCNGSSAQLFYIQNLADGNSRIVNENSNRCIEVYHSETTDYANIDQFKCGNSSPTQEWYVEY